MKAKFINEAFERKSKEYAKKNLLFPRLSEIVDLDSYKEITKEYNIPKEAIPQGVIDKIFRTTIAGNRWDKEVYINTGTWRGKKSDWESMKELFSDEQIDEIINKAYNAFELAIVDRDESIVEKVIKNQKGRIKSEQIPNAILYFGLDRFEEMVKNFNIKLTAANLIDVGLASKSKEYIIQGLEKGAKGRIGDIDQINKILGKDYNKYLGNKLTPEEVFSRGFTNKNDEMMLQGIKDGATNAGQSYQEAFTKATIGGNLKLIDALMKVPGFDPSINPKVGRENQRDERHWALRRAAKEGRIDVVKRILKDKRADPSYKNNFALKWAINGEHWDMVNLLLKDKRVKDDVSLLPNKHFEILKDKKLI